MGQTLYWLWLQTGLAAEPERKRYKCQVCKNICKNNFCHGLFKHSLDLKSEKKLTQEHLYVYFHRVLKAF